MRLDRQDSYLTRFHASVEDSRHDDRGVWLRLSRSAFYPTAGGQVHDTGIIRAGPLELAVADVEARQAEVWHLVEGEEARALQVGAEVEGRIDWDRRYRHMQRHTGQHLLSATLVRMDPTYETRSVSMRGPECTIDFAGVADEGVLPRIEEEANRAARRAMPVMTFEVPHERLGEFKLRRPSKVMGQVRLVAIGDHDLVACGGTHLRNSAEALPLKLLGLERVKGGLNRLTFRAGEEALEDHALKHSVTSALSVRLSAPPAEMVGRVEQLLEQVAEQARRLAEARRLRARATAERLLADAASGRVTAYLAGDEAELLDDLVELLQREPGTVSFLAAPDAGSARVRFAFVAGEGAHTDVREALNGVLSALGGRGGGRPDRAQGAAEVDEEAARAALSAAARGSA